MGVDDLQEQTLPTVLAVDDEPANLSLLRDVLSEGGYHPIFANNGERALTVAVEQQPDLVLLDIMMPQMDGYEVCRRMQESDRLRRIPIIFVTALSESRNEKKGLDLGAVDYITKPIDAALLLARIKNHITLAEQRHVAESALFRTTAQLRVKNRITDRLQRQLEESHGEALMMLHRASLLRDNETGRHVARTARYVHMLALAAGMGAEQAEMAALAAPMHDIGKIGIPDSILLKPGPLEREEIATMRTHPRIGAQIIGRNARSPLHRMSHDIALTHHERWDGGGYPDGLAGDAIPLPGRIMSIADVFDALTTNRPYKRAWPVERAVDEIIQQKEQRFDPDLVALFLNLIGNGQVAEVMMELADPVSRIDGSLARG